MRIGIDINMKATYRDVCSHNICHVKAVQVEFDPN